MIESEGSLHEEQFVQSFIQKERRERCFFLLSRAEKHRTFTTQLAHFPWLDERFSAAIPASVAHTSKELVALLKQKGAGMSVWVISEDSSIDGRELPVQNAMDSIWGSFKGTILSCIPGRLAFYHGEEMKSERLLQHS